MGWLNEFFEKHQSPETAARILLEQYKRFQNLDRPERLLKLFTTRETWKGVPEGTLREVITRLGNDDPDEHLKEVIRFILLSEDCERHAKRGGAIGNLRKSGSLGAAGVDLGLETAGMSLCAFADSLDLKRRVTALEYARRLAPNNGVVLAKLAVLFYAAGDFRMALENCDRALTHFQSLGYMKGLSHASSSLAPDLKAELQSMSGGVDEFVDVLLLMQKDCREQLSL